MFPGSGPSFDEGRRGGASIRLLGRRSVHKAIGCFLEMVPVKGPVFVPGGIAKAAFCPIGFAG